MHLKEFIPSWPKFFSDSFHYLKAFFKNPLQAIKALPDWNWLELGVLLLCFAVGSGLLAGAVAKSFTQILAGIFLLPISTFAFCTVTLAFIYYFSFFLLKRDMKLRTLGTVVVLASLPSLLLHPLVNLFPPLFFIGFLLSLAIVGVGIHHHFMIEKKHIYRISGILFLVVLGIWVTNQISNFRRKDVMESITSPESLDILERELKSTQ